jgi:hypothetical protein
MIFTDPLGVLVLVVVVVVCILIMPWWAALIASTACGVTWSLYRQRR